MIGGIKAGTTSVHDWIGQHPGARVPVRKELHFLDQDYGRGPRWYQAQFPVCGPGSSAVAVEATPQYLSHPLAPARLRAVVPDARLVVVLRDPVDRAVSHWKHRNREGRDPRTLEQVIDDEAGVDPLGPAADEADLERQRDRILLHGYYAIHLRRWFDEFGREQVLVLEFGDLIDRADHVIAAIFDHLGLPPWCGVDPRPLNVGDDRTVDDATRAALADLYRSRDLDLVTLLGRPVGWR